MYKLQEQRILTPRSLQQPTAPPSFFSLKVWFLTWVRWFFGTWVHPLFCRLALQIVTISCPNNLSLDLSTYCAASRTSLAWVTVDYGSRNPIFLLHLCSHLPLHLSVYAPQQSPRQLMGLPQPPLGPRSLLCFLHFLYIPSHSPWVSCLGLLERSLGEWQDCPTSGRLPSSMPKPRTLPRHPHHSLSSGISESHLLGNTFLDHPA